MSWSTTLTFTDGDVSELRFALHARLEQLHRRLTSADLHAEQLAYLKARVEICNSLIQRLDSSPVVREPTRADLDEENAR